MNFSDGCSVSICEWGKGDVQINKVIVIYKKKKTQCYIPDVAADSITPDRKGAPISFTERNNGTTQKIAHFELILQVSSKL